MTHPELTKAELNAIREALEVFLSEVESQSGEEMQAHSPRLAAAAKRARAKVCAMIAATEKKR